MTKQPPWNTVEPLRESHDCSQFFSSDNVLVRAEIDDWLRDSAFREHLGRSTTHVCLSGSTVIGFYTLAMISIDLSGASKRKQQRYAQGGTSTAPGVLIAKLGLAKEYQGGGNGSLLLREAFHSALALNAIAATRLIAVDALTEELVTFYEKHGMTRLSDGSTRLILGMSQLRGRSGS